jgi:subtilisin-like proprotein convertase family protein
MNKYGLFLAAIVALWLPSQVSANVPGQIHYQGMLKDSQGASIHCPSVNDCPSGPVSLTFRMYAQADGGEVLWEETWDAVAVSQGVVDIRLGQNTPIDTAALGGNEAWLGLAINDGNELSPRQRVVASAYAIVAATALEAQNAETLGGQPAEAYATVDGIAGLCVTEEELSAYGYLDEGAIETYLTENGYIAGPSLAGLNCDKGQVPTWGGDQWGCGNAALSADALAVVSNGLLTNQFVDAFSSGAPVLIPDNNPVGISDEITVPNIGLAQVLTVNVQVKNSDFGTVTVKLFDADDTEHLLFQNGDVGGDTLVATYPNPDQQVQGDLSSWNGKNPQGKWRLVVIDNGFLNNDTDGEIVEWSVQMQTLSNQKVAVTGDLIVDGQVKGDLDTSGTVAAGSLRAKPANEPPVACSPASEGTMYYDAVVQSLRVCNGTEYLRLMMCSEACPDPTDVACAEAVINGCGEMCGGEGQGLNSTQCLVNAAGTGCGLAVVDNCGNDCNLQGTALNLGNCADPSQTTCGEVIGDGCGNTCGTTGSLCGDGYLCSGGLCTAPTSCKAILEAGNSQGNGEYIIDPDAAGPLEPIKVYCDMDGGWTLCASLTKGYVPSHMLYNENAYAFQARKKSNDDFVYEREAPGKNDWADSEELNYGQFCRAMGAQVESRVESKMWNHGNCSGCNVNNQDYASLRKGTFSGNLFTTWFNQELSGSFDHTGGDKLTICTHDNAYGGPYLAKSVGWNGGSGDQCNNQLPYTHSSNPWGQADGGCVGCTSNGAYGSLPYGQTTILNNLGHPFWDGIEHVAYGWSDCTNNGDCDYHESGYGVWLFWVR